MAGLEERTVSEEMSPAPVCLSEGASLGVALAALVRERRDALPVVDAAGQVVGLVERARLLERLDELRTSEGAGRGLRDVLSADAARAIEREPVRCSGGMRLEEACSLMVREGATTLLVVRDGRLIGLLTLADVVRAVAGAYDERERVSAETDRSGRVIAACREVEPPPGSVLAAEHREERRPPDARRE